jgi:hypothetical protein
MKRYILHAILLICALALPLFANQAHAFDVYNPIALINDSVTYRYPLPHVMDWDGDGDWDMLVGEWGKTDSISHGRVRLFLNQGTNASPNLQFSKNVSAGGQEIDLTCG